MFTEQIPGGDITNISYPSNNHLSLYITIFGMKTIDQIHVNDGLHQPIFDDWTTMNIPSSPWLSDHDPILIPFSSHS